jgi:hypothetical protein
MQFEMWSFAGTNPEEEKDGISEMLLAWFQAGYSTARCIFLALFYSLNMLYL